MTSTNQIDTTHGAAPEAATPRDARALVGRALVQEAKMREKLARLAETDYARGRDFQRVYLRSFPAKIGAADTAAKKLKAGFTDAQVIELAKGIDPFRGTSEAVRMYPSPKVGGYRPITSFGVENKALQILVKRAAEPFIRIHPHQFDAPGHGGPPAACRRILDLLGAGFVHVVVADIEGNFNSLRAEGIKEIVPLPPAVTEAVVLARGLNINPNKRRYDDAKRAGGRQRANAPEGRHDTRGQGVLCSLPLRGIAKHAQSGTKLPGRLKESLRKGWRGISQGSVGSPLFSAAIHEPMVRNVSRQEEVVHYTDNFFLFAKTRAGAIRAAKTLQAEFQRSPAGPLLCSKCIIVDARHGFRALGFTFRVRSGRATVRVPKHKLQDCHTKFLGMFDDVALGKMTREGAVDYLDGWVAAHRLWPHWRLWRRLLIGRLDQYFPPPAGPLGRDPGGGLRVPPGRDTRPPGGR